jgi:protein-L-isoaspartate(D-aspartate) O-methyltransferase
MVDTYLIPEGITNKRVLQAMKTVPRHKFVIRFRRKYAYYDGALEIGYGQTISPPFIVAYMTQSLDPQPDDKVLEIGTGSGYQAAVLGEICKEVYSIEIIEPLGKQAAERLKKLGYDNIKTKVGDGYLGWPEHAPFDKIIVTCSPEKIPQPLKDQLAEGGRMIIPVGERYQQVFYLLEKKDGELVEKELIPTLFVPMTGISAQKREVKPDPLNPKIVNGSFELDENEDGRPDAWHYQRQLKYIQTGGSNGQKCVRFFNLEPGHTCQALQGLGVDGQKLGTLQVRASATFENLRPGREDHEKPGVQVYFYDYRRKFIRLEQVGPWVGNSNWKRFGADVPIPPDAREMVLQIGINGGTGTLVMDDVRIRALPRR